jgi:phosphomannomutase
MGNVMNQLMQAASADRVQTPEGVKVERDGQWVAIIPDSTQPAIRLYFEPSDHGVLRVDEYRSLVEAALRNG